MGYDKAHFDRRVQEILDLDRLGLPIADELVSEVRSAGADDLLYNATQREDYEAKDNYDGRKHLWLYRTPEKRKDEPNYYDRVPQEWKDKWAGVDITRAHWLPEGAPEEITDELRRFVLSGNPRFDKLLAYEPFYLYCEQARRWGAEDGRIEDCKSEGEQEAFAMQEFARARDNKLYGLDKYATIKDEAIPGGRRKYKASTPQALLMFLKDCGFSYILLKGRQAAITSTMMAAAQLTALVTPSYKGALVVDKEKTGFNIFNDKFKSTYQFMPDWWKPEVEGNWSNKTVLLDFDPGERKSDKRRFTAEFSTYPASDPQTINASTPTETYFDEAQKMSTLQDILGELRPTMLANIDDELKILRAAYAWGTGGSGDAGKGMFEAEFNGVFSMLEQRQDTDGWFAIFFDAFCRPGMDEKRYRKEYAKYMKGDVKGVDFRGMSHEQKEALFAAHYPMSPADCFMSSTRTVVPSIIIKSQRDKIISTPEPLLPKKGRFEPVYDQKQPQPEGSFLPFKLTGAKWIPAKPHEYDAPVSMFMPPHNDWADRYVQGTDPIQSDTGQSRMGSAIWDGAGRILETAHGKLFVPTVACMVNYRTHKPKETFLQCVLMGMHYHNYGQKKCRELVEMEQGHNYMTFQDDTAVDTGDYLIYPGELMPAFHGGQLERGISMKKERKSRAHIELQELCFDHLHNIYHMDFINQLSSIETEERQDGSVAFSTKDVRRSNDDVVMAVLFSYIAWKSLSLVPKKIGSKDAPVTIRRTVAQRRADGSLGWVKVDTPMEYA